jgi:predicted DNA-binding protein
VSAKNRISVSFADDAFVVLERLSGQTRKSKAEIIRAVVEEYLRENPDRFRRKVSIDLKRTSNLLLNRRVVDPDVRDGDWEKPYNAPLASTTDT